jgi:hypothetical protein
VSARRSEVGATGELWQKGIEVDKAACSFVYSTQTLLCARRRCRYATRAFQASAREKLFYMGRLRNTKHERFAHAVAALVPLGTAYREAGFRGNERWHPYNGSRLANQPAVKERIEELRREFERNCADGAIVHANYVRAQLLPLIETDGAELFEPDPEDPTKRRLRDICKLPKHLTKAISRVKLDAETGRPSEIVLFDKTTAAATLLRSLAGGVVERRELVGKDGAPLFDGMTDAKVVEQIVEQTFEIFAKMGFSTDLLADLRAELDKLCPAEDVVDEVTHAVGALWERREPASSPAVRRAPSNVR